MGAGPTTRVVEVLLEEHHVDHQDSDQHNRDCQRGRDRVPSRPSPRHPDLEFSRRPSVYRHGERVQGPALTRYATNRSLPVIHPPPGIRLTGRITLHRKFGQICALKSQGPP
jgi:hypothetical protein